MKFYRENKVNPFASCLPLVAQLPVFISLFYMLRKDLRLDICPEVNGPAHPHYAIRCRAAPAATSAVPVHPGPDEQGDRRRPDRLIVLYVGSQLVSTLLMSTPTDRNQRMIMLALPFVFVAFVIRFPAGLLVYWITTNIWTIVQQAIVRKRLGPLRPATAEGESPGGLFGGLGGLLHDRPEVRRDPVDEQAGRELDDEDDEEERQRQEDHPLRRGPSSSTSAASRPAASRRRARSGRSATQPVALSVRSGMKRNCASPPSPHGTAGSACPAG